MSTQRAPFAHAPALAAAAASALLSAAVLLRRPLVNNDGVYYMLAAEAFAEGGLAAARAVYLWPFFSVLVAAVAAVLRVSTETAAQLTCAALLALASGAFVSVVRDLGGSRRVQWLAAAVVVAHPWLNMGRDEVLRDTGVWALGLLALRALLRMEHPRAGHVALWAVPGAAAVLFRPDAAALLLAAPLAMFLGRDGARRRLPWAAGVLVAALAVLAAVLGWMFTQPTIEVSGGHFRRAAAALADAFPLPYGREYAPFLLAAGLAFLPLVKTLKTMGLVHLGLSTAGALRARPESAFHRRAIAATQAAAALPLVLQAGRLLFVESRYTVFATLVLALLAPFGAAWIVARAPRWGAAVVGAALVLTLAASVPLGDTSGAHVRAAARWVRDNAHGAKLRTNSPQIAYLSGAAVDLPLVQQALVNGALDGSQFRPGDLWAVRVAPGDAALRRRLEAMPSFARRASFEGAGGDAVYVYACSAEAGCRAGSGR